MMTKTPRYYQERSNEGDYTFSFDGSESIDDSASLFLPELEASSGLFLEREAGHWSFAHLTFQEYLAAAFWLSQSDFKALVESVS